eukprot:6471914-Amphidinium_carterae.1
MGCRKRVHVVLEVSCFALANMLKLVIIAIGTARELLAHTLHAQGWSDKLLHSYNKLLLDLHPGAQMQHCA